MGYGSVSELTGGEKRDRGYRIRILMLTLLAPDILGAIMDGRQGGVKRAAHLARVGRTCHTGSGSSGSPLSP